jgi:hypothetical protein
MTQYKTNKTYEVKVTGISISTMTLKVEAKGKRDARRIVNSKNLWEIMDYAHPDKKGEIGIDTIKEIGVETIKKVKQ